MTAPAEQQAPVVLTCRICTVPYYSDQKHVCQYPPVERAVEAQKRKADIHFRGDEMHEVLEWLSAVCGRYLNLPERTEEIKGRYHYEVGYVWSYKVQHKWQPFSTFGGV